MDICVCFSENPLELSPWTHPFLPGEKGRKHVFWDCRLHWAFHQLSCSSGPAVNFPTCNFSLVSIPCQSTPSGERLFRSFLCPIWWYVMWCQHSYIITPGTLSLCSCFLGFLHLISETQVSLSPGGLAGMFRFLFPFTPLILISGISYESWDSLLFHHTSSE